MIYISSYANKIPWKAHHSILTFHLITICYMLLCGAFAQAHDKVVVIPLLSNNSKPLKNVVTVAKSNGDFYDPVAALASINDASINNPYLIVIAPGVYTLTEGIVMKEHVSIIGSGKDVTELNGAISSDNLDITSAIVKMTSNAFLSNLSLKNSGGNSYSIGIYSGGFRPCRIENVTVAALGATKNYGIYNQSNCEMTDITITVSGGTSGSGIVNNLFYRPILTNFTITVSDTESSYGIVNNHILPMNDGTIKVKGNTYSCGMSNDGEFSSSTMSNISIMASGEAETLSVYGIRHRDRSSSTMTNCSVTATGGVTSYGVFSSTNSDSHIRRSTLSGDTHGLMQENSVYGSVTISQSTIKNGVGGNGHMSCVACDNGSGGAFGAECKLK